ncbi:MAG: ThiF family adenylyltransferase [Promethearchaeota archaeon]
MSKNYFDRQEQILWFSQKEVSSKIITILGIGGIGCNLALLCTRLGVRKLNLIDYDKIEASNLNRQTLYSKKDIGKYKAQVAEATLNKLDNLSTELVAYNYNIFEDWKKTVSIIESSHYVLNGLDLPEIKRTLLGILCFKLKKPMIYAGTDPHSGYSGMVLYQSSKLDEPCHECLQAILNSIEKKELIKKYSLNNILNHDIINWLELEKPDYNVPSSGATTAVTAMFASTIAVNILVHIIHNIENAHRIIFDLFSNTIENYTLKKRNDCLICGNR